MVENTLFYVNINLFSAAVDYSACVPLTVDEHRLINTYGGGLQESLCLSYLASYNVVLEVGRRYTGTIFNLAILLKKE